MCRPNQWSNYQKISKGAHTFVNANEAMLLITGGSRTSESGDKFFLKFFDDFLGAFLKSFCIFPPKMFIYSAKISDDLFFFLVIDLFQVLIRNFSVAQVRTRHRYGPQHF